MTLNDRSVARELHPEPKEEPPMTTIYRQGDVLIRRVQGIPDSATPVVRDNGRIVLAYGEVTGHAHAIAAPPSEATLLTDAEEARFLRLVSTVDVVHEEHATVTLPPGDYEVIRQREYTAADMEPRQVAD